MLLNAKLASAQGLSMEKSWGTFFTIMDTCCKLGVNSRKYFYDRIPKRNKMPPFASLIVNVL